MVLLRPYVVATMLVVIGVMTHVIPYLLRRQHPLFMLDSFQSNPVPSLALFFMLAQVIGIPIMGLGANPCDCTTTVIVWRSILGALAVEVLMLAGLGCLNTRGYPYSACFISFMANASISATFLVALRQAGLQPLSLLLVGANPENLAMVRAKLMATPRLSKSRFMTFTLADAQVETMAKGQIPKELQQLLGQGDIDDVVLVHGERPEDHLLSALYSINGSGRRLYVVPSLYEVVISARRTSFVAQDLRLLEVESHLDGWDYAALKRGVDIVSSLLLGAATLPLMALAALAILLSSGKPVLYSQIRVGKGSRLFRIYKFRTMIPDAERETGIVLAAKRDPRVTRIGHFLRKTRIDELPQLWNVLNGSMSLVGPRPERPEFVDGFRKAIPGYELRHRVKPGLTGLAQVSASYHSTPAEKLRFDLAYVYNYSPAFDAYLLARTVSTVLFRSGS